MSTTTPLPLQYVVLRHEAIDQPHYDLMFETLPGSDLATWRSAFWPLAGPVPLTRLRDHRRAFLTFQGELAGHGGRVHQIARGVCKVEIGEDAVWTIRLLDDPLRTVLQFRQIERERWEGSAKKGAADLSDSTAPREGGL